jgi:hypothetical protein
LLERPEGQRAGRVRRLGGKQLAVDDQSLAESCEGGDDLRIPAGDVVQCAREEHDPVACDVGLRADAVVLVLEDEWGRQPRGDLIRRREGLRQHEAERVKERQGCRVERIRPRPLRHLAQIATQ